VSEVVTSIDIDAPVQEVWRTVMDPERLADWVTIHRRLISFDGDEMEQVLCLRGANFKVRWHLESQRAPFHAEWHGRGPARSHAETGRIKCAYSSPEISSMRLVPAELVPVRLVSVGLVSALRY